jgi:hypothetical protein
MLMPGFILRTLAGVALALIASIALGLGHKVHAMPVMFALIGWAFSLANGLLAAILLHYSRKPPISIAIAAVSLVFYPLIQYHLAEYSSDRGVVLEISQLIIGGYLISGIIILAAIYTAGRDALVYEKA